MKLLPPLGRYIMPSEVSCLNTNCTPRAGWRALGKELHHPSENTFEQFIRSTLELISRDPQLGKMPTSLEERCENGKERKESLPPRADDWASGLAAVGWGRALEFTAKIMAAMKGAADKRNYQASKRL